MTRKLISLMLAMLMVAALIPASVATAGEELPFVTIDWYYGQGEQQPDHQIVNDAVNEYLLEKLNCNVNLITWTSSDIEKKLTVMISAGQDCGIIGFGSQTKLDYVVQSQRGAYYPLNDLLESYGAETKALFPDPIWEGMKVGGNIYGIPSKKDNGYFISLIYNDTMLQELVSNGLLDANAIENANYSNFRDLEELALAVKAGRDQLHPEWAEYPVFWDNARIYPYNFAFETFLNDSYVAVCDIDAFDQIAGYDETQVVNFYATDEFREYCIQKQRMVEEGIYLYDYTDRRELQYDGGVFGWTGWGYCYMEEHMFGENFTTKMQMSNTIWTETNNYYSAGTAISSQCADPERAMMILNLINTDSEFATMMRFGVEGTHYTFDDEGKMHFTERNATPGSRGYYNWYMAPVGNLLIVKAPETLTGPDNIMMTNMQHYNDVCVVPAHFGFGLDTAPIANEIAACTNIIAEYEPDLIRGQVDSADEVNALIDEFVAKLQANGADQIVAEVQAQIDAWVAAK
ncbi:MAG: ABC transporter substrate-binding protein [Christensenellales bacterium]|jgi:putative aldouronate transport system substrate-binding protein